MLGCKPLNKIINFVNEDKDSDVKDLGTCRKTRLLLTIQVLDADILGIKYIIIE